MVKFRQVLSYLIPFLLALLFIWIIGKTINVPKLLERVSDANFQWVSIAILISLLSHLSRAYRWNILLEPLGYKPKLSTTFAALMVGYFGNIFLPRGGEVMRCLVLTKTDKIPFNSSFGTVVADRAFDFITLLILIAFSFVLEFERFKNFFYTLVFKEKTSRTIAFNYNHPILIIFLLLSILLVVWIFIKRKKIREWSFVEKCIGFSKGILQGVLSIKNSNRKGAFLLHSVLIWLCYFFMTYLMFFSLQATKNLGPVAGLVILIVGGLGMAAPVSGGIGPFHLMVAGALHLFYNISKDDGVAYAFVIHTSQLISILIVGGISAIWVLISERRAQNESAIVSTR